MLPEVERGAVARDTAECPRGEENSGPKGSDHGRSEAPQYIAIEAQVENIPMAEGISQRCPPPPLIPVLTRGYQMVLDDVEGSCIIYGPGLSQAIGVRSPASRAERNQRDCDAARGWVFVDRVRFMIGDRGSGFSL